MKLKKIGLSLCLTAMASVVFNIGAAACTVPAASGTGASVRQGTQNSYTQRQVQFPYAVVDELGGVLTKADALVKQELAGQQSSQPMSSQPAESQPTSSQPADQQAAQQAWQQFAAQADAKKKTIDGNTQKIASVNKSCQDVVNKIVATAAANKDVLANQGSGMADIVVQLGTVRTDLAAESNGKISEALKAYAEALKKKDYDGALAQLDAIIGIQNSRISAVQSALSQLQSALSSLQNLVATAAASSASSAVSSQAA